VRDYPQKNKLVNWISTKGESWDRWARGNTAVSGSSYFKDLWHTSEWFKEFALWGAVFVCSCIEVKNYKHILIRGASIITSFYLGGELFYYLYHNIWLIK
jgi:hypothetical protein